MTPKEKAQELYDKFQKHSNGFNTVGTHDAGKYHTKKCALIAVEEIINFCKSTGILNTQFYDKVKEEINKL